MGKVYVEGEDCNGREGSSYIKERRREEKETCSRRTTYKGLRRGCKTMTSLVVTRVYAAAAAGTPHLFAVGSCYRRTFSACIGNLPRTAHQTAASQLPLGGNPLRDRDCHPEYNT